MAEDIDLMNPLYQTMAKQLPGALQRVGQKTFIDDSWNPMFCLYAAEWWRRNYSSGPWSWDGIYESIGWQSVTSHERSERVANGLKWWKRTVFKREGRNLFLVTIACEGGTAASATAKGKSIFRYLLQPDT